MTSWLTVAWSVSASMCLTLALVHLVMWLQPRRFRTPVSRRVLERTEELQAAVAQAHRSCEIVCGTVLAGTPAVTRVGIDGLRVLLPGDVAAARHRRRGSSSSRWASRTGKTWSTDLTRPLWLGR